MTWQTPRERVTVLAEMARRQAHVAERLGKLREELELTQEEAAHRAGVSFRTWQRWEAGESMPHNGNLRRVAKAFKVAVADFFPELEAPSLAPARDDLQTQLDGITERLAALEGAVQTVVALLRQEAQEELDEPADDKQLDGEAGPNAAPTPLPLAPPERDQRQGE